MSIIKNSEDLANLRHSCRILISCFEHLGGMIRAGISAGELDQFAIAFIRSYDGEPSFLGYQGFKYAICTSINDEVAHGISPITKIIPNNCLVKLDMGVRYKGMISDSCRTYIIGEVDPKYHRLVEVNKEAMMQFITIFWRNISWRNHFISKYERIMETLFIHYRGLANVLQNFYFVFKFQSGFYVLPYAQNQYGCRATWRIHRCT